jgi:23S rRNA pseudouridine2605 synthase
MEKLRLNKFLRNCGAGSRRKVEELILAGKVSINGSVTRELGTIVEPTDVVCIDGEEISMHETLVYYMLNKPKGYLCSHTRRPGEKLIYDLFPDSPPLFSVGRLDKDTTGLLLVTNDGAFANKVIHPSSDITKEYIARVEETIKAFDITRLQKGANVEGVFVIPHKVEKLSAHSVKIIVKEGKKREVRILVKAAGLTLKSLTRTKIGNLELGSLPEGEFKSLSEEEILVVGKN